MFTCNAHTMCITHTQCVLHTHTHTVNWKGSWTRRGLLVLRQNAGDFGGLSDRVQVINAGTTRWQRPGVWVTLHFHTHSVLQSVESTQCGIHTQTLAKMKVTKKRRTADKSEIIEAAQWRLYRWVWESISAFNQGKNWQRFCCCFKN